MTVHGHELNSQEVEVVFTCSSADKNADVSWETHADHQTVVLLNVHQTQELINEGLSRELTNRIQMMRKDAKLHHIHVATAYCTFKPEGHLRQVAEKYLDQISRTTATRLRLDEEPTEEPTLTQTHKVQWQNKTLEEEFAVSVVIRLLF